MEWIRWMAVGAEFVDGLDESPRVAADALTSWKIGWMSCRTDDSDTASHLSPKVND